MRRIEKHSKTKLSSSHLKSARKVPLCVSPFFSDEFWIAFCFSTADAEKQSRGTFDQHKNLRHACTKRCWKSQDWRGEYGGWIDSQDALYKDDITWKNIRYPDDSWRKTSKLLHLNKFRIVYGRCCATGKSFVQTFRSPLFVFTSFDVIFIGFWLHAGIVWKA